MSFQDAMVEALKQSSTGQLEFEAKVTVVPSDSDTRDFYYVLELGKFLPQPDESGTSAIFEPDGPPVCAKCRGFRFRDTCQHVERLTAQRQKERPENG